MTDHFVPDRVARDGVRPSSHARLASSTLFACALLAFLLPFATVSCGEPVTFTGVELATARVAEDAPTAGERSFGDEIEGEGTVLALTALVATALGLGLAVAGVRGWGLAALVALLSLLLLPWAAAAAFADFQVHEGYVLATGSAAGVVGMRRAAAVRRRSREARRRWPAVLVAVPLALFVAVTAWMCIDAAQYV